MGEACLFWYAIRVRTGSERRAFEQLEQIGLEAFFPFYLEKVRWSDRKKTVERALFPGYIFGRFANRLPVLNIPCVLQVLGDDRGPIAVPDPEIEAVRQLLASGMIGTKAVQCQVGQSVLIDRGPLRGVTGTVTRIQKARVWVSVVMMGRPKDVAFTDQDLKAAA